MSQAHIHTHIYISIVLYKLSGNVFTLLSVRMFCHIEVIFPVPLWRVSKGRGWRGVGYSCCGYQANGLPCKTGAVIVFFFLFKTKNNNNKWHRSSVTLDVFICLFLFSFFVVFVFVFTFCLFSLFFVCLFFFQKWEWGVNSDLDVTLPWIVIDNKNLYPPNWCLRDFFQRRFCFWFVLTS